MPVCSIYQGDARHAGSPPICVCPTRFFQADLIEDIRTACWPGVARDGIQVAHEVQMHRFGKVDLVLAEIPQPGRIANFLPVELQAVDITGSYLPYYEGLTLGRPVEANASYGINWANVRKRFLSQIVSKGRVCFEWGTRIVAVVQENLFASFYEHARIPELRMDEATVVFMLYQYERVEGENRWQFRLSRIVPTNHTNVMNASLNERMPSKFEFERRILLRIGS